MKKYLTILISACLTIASLTTHAAEDLLIFPEIRTVSFDNSAPYPSDSFATVDFFGSAHYEQFRILAEVFLTQDNIEAERLQLGYYFNDQTSLWLGRFHNQLGYWNTQYHHGTYLQTSISRPEITKLEHNGGLFPSHITGLLLQTSHDLSDDGVLDFSLSAGSSPELREADSKSTIGPVLHPLQIFNPAKGDHKLNISARLAYRPSNLFNNQLGLFASQTEISAKNIQIDSIKLNIAGLFAYWEKDSLNLYSALFYTTDRIESSAQIETGSFSSGYLQLDYLIQDEWTLFGRLEDTYGEKDDPYLAIMQNFSPQAQVTGIRWDITHNQAIKLEISRKLLGDNFYSTSILNWSAVFP